MKNIFTLIVLFTSLIYFSQGSEFIEFVSPTTSFLNPESPNMIEPKTHIIKPNFKGRELIEVDNSNTHLPDWAWQQYELAEKNAVATKLWDVQGI
ncbi:MAG: hypothetical protein FJX84_08135, partial [Bacteroidetes bacterium]|nr:hypothetical protein [Bacteroidota bacterium]